MRIEEIEETRTKGVRERRMMKKMRRGKKSQGRRTHWPTISTRESFLFVYHYSGAEKDVLSEAIRGEATRQNIKVKTVSVDKEAGSGDLLEDEPYNQHLIVGLRGV